MKKLSQRDLMRDLVKKYGDDTVRIMREYAIAEIKGIVERKSNLLNLSAEDYAYALLKDGMKKGWISSS
jgi:hypothetical protein